MSQEPALVSIVMPTYNQGQYIGESIASVLAQTYTCWELLIVDDGSTDGTRGVVQRFSDDRIVLISNECNEGTAQARNRALRQARGQYVAFLDSDDRWMPEKLERQVAFMRAHGYVFSYHQYRKIDGEGKTRCGVISGKSRVTHGDILRCCWMGCLTVMYDARCVGTVQVESIGRNNDTALWLKVSEVADCHLLKECLAEYRQTATKPIGQRMADLFMLYREYLHYSVGKSLACLCVGTMMFGVKKVAYRHRCWFK